jgi:MATE family multidrug resistance protein
MHQNKVLHRQIWQLAWPMIISNISVPLLGIVDTAILGHLQQATHLGAVALGSSVLAFV